MLRQWKHKYKGETCVIIGNGPSLRDTPLSELNEKYITFGSNKIYEYPFTPDYWTCVDLEMLRDCLPWLYKHEEFQPILKITTATDIPVSPLHIQITSMTGGGFSPDAREMVFVGATVTYAQMQIAYYMGFDKVVLVGCDHSYPKVDVEGLEGRRFIADGKDLDHFSETYFTEGRVYNRPNLAKVEEYFYPLALQEFKKAGKEIVNCSAKTKLTCFDWENIERYL